MKRIKLQPLGEDLVMQTGTTVLSTLLAKQLNVKMSCGGRGLCATCRVTVEKGGDSLSPMENREKKTLSLVQGSTPSCRLACQSRIYGDGVVVQLPKGMYIEKAEDLLSLLGTRAPENILHPIFGNVLIPKDKIITRTLFEQTKLLEKEVERVRNAKTGGGDSESQLNSSTIGNGRFLATGSGIAPASMQDTFSSTVLRATSINPIKTKPSYLSPNIPLPPSTNPRKLEPGVQIGKFLLIEQIGRGASGLVFRASNLKLKSMVALKFLHPDAQHDREARIERFRNEAHLLAQINHPNIVRVLDFEDNPILPFVVMEYVEGLSGLDLLKQNRVLPVDRASNIVLQAAKGLQAAHKLGIIHRDVKPGNLLVSRDDTTRILDLGLALKIEGDGENPSASGEGTAAYMPPEQLIDGSQIDHRSDIYSLGVTFYHLITGKLPYTAASRKEMFMEHMSSNPPKPSKVRPEIPNDLSNFILEMMHMDLENRPQSYDSVIERLTEYATDNQLVTA
ncbi:protein kinase [Telmatocola sphagniphila]|uniref:Protein kinase n=1 Tax=Telmatocola sphagniphila TaxID=1123043 RepID=A0A8E6EW13_9BACT|nr:protein kinase [Telmatocola sphagniphila]QVL33322.1 protein kinase [Telmatocola sphagniphila]